MFTLLLLQKEVGNSSDGVRTKDHRT